MPKIKICKIGYFNSTHSSQDYLSWALNRIKQVNLLFSKRKKKLSQILTYKWDQILKLFFKNQKYIAQSNQSDDMFSIFSPLDNNESQIL